MHPPLQLPLATAKFSLNSAGVAGFFGGDEAISAMATVHLYEGRRWLGWFNSPGSYTVAKRFGRMANSRFWDGLFPGSNDSPAVSFELDGKDGPEYIAGMSGTTMRTGHLAYLTMERVKDLKVKAHLGERTTEPVNVAYLAMKHVDYKKPIKRLPLKLGALYGLIPIAVSVIACVMCGLVGDWISFSMILLGIFSSGWACYVIGEGTPVLKSVDRPAKGSPPGHGILLSRDGVVVIKGKERDVNAITKGRFDLEARRKLGDEEEGRGDEEKKHEAKVEKRENKVIKQEDKTRKPQDKAEKPVSNHYHAIGVCSLLLLLQFLLQLLIIPQGTLFGQTMFLVSLGVSWGYNSYLSSLEKEKVQTRLLFEKLEVESPAFIRFQVRTRTAMSAFACLLLFHNAEVSYYLEDKEETVGRVLDSCIPNNTRVWKRWKAKVIKQLLDKGTQTHLPHLKLDEEIDGDLVETDRHLLEKLLGDAQDAFKGYLDNLSALPEDSTHI